MGILGSQRGSILASFTCLRPLTCLSPYWHSFGTEPASKMPVDNTWKAQLLAKCPRCREGDVFKYPLKQVLKFSEMHEDCPVCGATFSPEPGFYFGAMFVSYALSVILFLVVGCTFYFLFHPSDLMLVISVTVVAILFTPFSFRYSRILFLYWFGGYHYQRKG